MHAVRAAMSVAATTAMALAIALAGASGASASDDSSVTVDCASLTIAPTPGWEEVTGNLTIGRFVTDVELVADPVAVNGGTSFPTDGTFNSFFFEFAMGQITQPDVEIKANYRLNGVSHSSNICNESNLVGLTWFRPDFLSGSDRYETSVAVARAAYPATTSAVLVASGDNYPDALSAGPAAAQLDAPLLLVKSDSLPGAVAQEIADLAPQDIFVVGGPAAVSDPVFDQLARLAPDIHRLWGADRFATSRAVASGIFSGATTSFIATGNGFADAISSVAAASSVHAPILLVNGSAASLDAATLQTLSGLYTQNVTVIGGDAAVSSGIEAQLADNFPVDRLGGTDRYETSNLVNARYFGPTADHVYVTAGNNFPDALSGSTIAAVNGAPLMIVNPICIPAYELHSMANWGTTAMTIIGGNETDRPELAQVRSCPEVKFFNPWDF